ncbi:hypothetical protein QWY31_16115 [Cytophagales bacterium LB-30]|uniref:Uncharacterized protein n=1 Tax=Shiella aurantiaca TaxID=3058365 RepID=A0ABT8F979_9BACT|nr:hypothetical protein [Shiella aurantiaca]MDN4167037.1 hypothetical protein [Shiella aurantiaca]
MKALMTIVLDRIVRMVFLTLLFFVMFSCESERNLHQTVIEGVLKESLLQYDLYDSTLNKGVVAVKDTSVIISQGDRESIVRHLEEITHGDIDKKRLIDILLNQQSKDVISAFSLTNFKLQSKVAPDDVVIGSVYLSGVVATGENPSLVLFFYRFRCGNDCGSGNIVFAKKNKDKWEIELVYPLYMI